jgi:hypothetical protein
VINWTAFKNKGYYPYLNPDLPLNSLAFLKEGAFSQTQVDANMVQSLTTSLEFLG